MMLLKEIISNNSFLEKELGKINSLFLNLQVSGITSNSKEVNLDFIFVAIKGKKFDGTKYINEAIANGAKCIISDSNNKDNNIIKVKEGSCRRIYALLASAFYKNQPAQIVGVTGTNGKTSVVEFCRQIWNQAGWRAASMGTLGTKLSENQRLKSDLPAINNLTTFEPSNLYKELNKISNQEITHLAIEASSHGIDQCRLDGIKFSGAVFTNLSHDHLDYHQNMKNYFDVKKNLFIKNLTKNSAVAINIDDKYGSLLHEELKKLPLLIITFGENPKADICLKSSNLNSDSINLNLDFNGTKYTSTLGMIGHFQISNVLAAAAICICLGLEANFVFKSLGYLKPAPGRMQIVSGHPSGAIIIIDYAHSPDALFSVLNSLKETVKGRLITLFGCGGDRDKAKRKIMGEVATNNSDQVYITDDNPRTENPSEIRKEILKGCSNAIEISNRDEAIKDAVSKLKKHDLLLIAGKGHETFQNIGTESLPFDDYTVTNEAIKNLLVSEIKN